MRRGQPAGRALGILALVAATLTGCSQIAALAPVGGNALAEVRFGAIDILHSRGVDMLTAPVCTEETDGAVRCSGTTTSGEDISVISSTAANATLEITVAGRAIFSGALSDVLDEAARS